MKNLFSIEYDDIKTIVRFFGIKISCKPPLYKLKQACYQLKNFKYEITHSFNKIFFAVPKIVKKEDLVQILIDTDKSISRFGDGEFYIILNEKSLKSSTKESEYQGYDEYIVRRSKEILQSRNENLCVCIPALFENLNMLCPKAKKAWRILMGSDRKKIYGILNMYKTYYDSFISRPYICFKKDKNFYKEIETYFKKMKKIWDNKDIIFVEGYGSRLGIGNDLFDNVKSIKRILCPNENAYKKYTEIINECTKHSKNSLFILALGMTATVLAADLCELGYRALDMGHIDIEYEWFLMKAEEKVDIPNKNVNECGNPSKNNKINDIEYEKQIVTIL